MKEERVLEIAKSKWYGMKSRAGKDDAYLDVEICEDWLEPNTGRANFIEWSIGQWKQGYLHEGFELDKDIVGNSKIYSPDHCCFVPHEINAFFIGTGINDPYVISKGAYLNYKGEWSFHWDGKGYATYCDNEMDTFEEFLMKRRDKLLGMVYKYQRKIRPDVIERCENWAMEQYNKYIDLKISQFL